MALPSKERAGFVLVPGPGEVIDGLKVRTALLDISTAVTPNYFVRQEDIKLGKQDSHQTVLTNLSDPLKQRSQLLVRAGSSKEVFAVKCLVSGKYDRRQRSLNDQQYHEATALRRYTKIKDTTRKEIYAKAVRDENQPAWDDYEVQNYVCYILDGHDHILNLCGFAQWTETGNVNKGLLLLYYEYCKSGTLLEYAKRCYSQRRKAVETFIIEHIALQLLSVVDWLQSKEFILLRPSLLHRNIRPENVFLHHVDGSDWPIVKLGGFEKLTPFDGSTEHIKSIDQRSLWDAPEFPAYFESSDIWSIGAVVYAALAYGQPPPVDTRATFLHSHLNMYSVETHRILGYMLITDPSKRSSAAHISEAILEVKDTIRARENPISWDKVREDPLHEPTMFIEEYMVWLESQAEQYLAKIHTLACQNQCNLGAKDAALPKVDIFEEETCRLLEQWCRKAVVTQKSVAQSEIKDCGHFMATNIYSFLKPVGDELWHATRAQYLAILAPRRGRLLGGQQYVPAIVRIRAKDFISYIQPLVEDVFWRIASDHAEEQLNAFPQEDLISVNDPTNNATEYAQLPADKHNINQDGIPSLEEIAEALQSWLIEKYHQGVLEYARIEERLLNKSRIHDIRATTEASLLDLPRSWFLGAVGKHRNIWYNHVEECFQVSWKASIRRLGNRKQPLRTPDLIDLYRIAEDFALETVPVSTNCIRVTKSKQEDHRESYDELINFLNWQQRHWNKKWRLYPESDGSPVAALKDNLPSTVPSFSGVRSDLTAIDGVKSRIQKQIEEARKSWSESFGKQIKFYHSSSAQKEEKDPARYTDRAKDVTARELAEKINIAPSDASAGSLDPLLRQNVAYLAAYKSILQELQIISTSTSKQRREQVENKILEALWPLEYAAIVCSDQRNTFRELVSSCLTKSGQQFRRMKEAPSDDKVQTQIANFENKASRSLTILYKGLGFPEDSKQIEAAAEQLAEKIEDRMMEWRSKSKGVTVPTLKAAAETFAKACDHLFDREWARFRENYAKYIINMVNPSSTSKPTAAGTGNPQNDLPIEPTRKPSDNNTQPPTVTQPPVEYPTSPIQQPLEVPNKSPKPPAPNKSVKQNPMVSRKRKGNYPEPRTKVQILSDEDTDWGYSDLGKDGSWPSTSSSPSPPPPSSPNRRIIRRIHSPITISDGRDEADDANEDDDKENQPHTRDSDQADTTRKNRTRAGGAGPGVVIDEPSTDVHSRPSSNQEVEISASPPPATTTKNNDLPQQEPKTPVDPLQMEFEALSAHANIDWPIDTLEQRRRLLDAETNRAMAYHELGNPYAWEPARSYRATSNPVEMRITITTDSGNYMVDRKVWSRQVRPQRGFDLPPPPPPSDPSGPSSSPSWSHKRPQSRQNPHNSDLSNDNNENHSKGRDVDNPPGIQQAKTVAEAEEKQSEGQVSNQQARHGSLSPSQSRKRTSPFGSEQAAKRSKPWDGVSDASATWTDIGKALIEVVPGAKSIAKTATNIAKLFSSSPREAANPQEVQSEPAPSSPTSTNIGSSATTVLLDSRSPSVHLRPRPNDYRSRATLFAPRHIPPRTPAAQVVEWPYHGSNSTAFPGIASIGSGPNLTDARPTPRVPIGGDGIAPISKEQLEYSLKAIPNSAALKLMYVTQTDAIPPRSVSKPDTSQQPQRGSRLRSPIQLVRSQQANFSNPERAGSGHHSSTPAMDWQQTPPGFTIYEDEATPKAQQAPSLSQPQPQKEGMFRYVEGKCFKMKRISAAEMIEHDKLLSDEEQFEHEDERQSRSWNMSWDARNKSWGPSSEPQIRQSRVKGRDMSWEPSSEGQKTQYRRDMSWEVTNKPPKTHLHVEVSKSIPQKDIDLPDYEDEEGDLAGKLANKKAKHKRKLVKLESKAEYPAVRTAIGNKKAHPQKQVKKTKNVTRKNHVEKELTSSREDNSTNSQESTSKFETLKQRVDQIALKKNTRQKSKLSTTAKSV